MQNLKNKINQNINLDILKRLNFIYRSIISEDKTLEYSKKINKLINNYKDIGPKNSKNDYWSENTILLITYADSISRGLSGKTLNDFGKFYKKYLEKFINSIHFLPFFPSSGDGGFSVKNHNDVDKAYGTWEDIQSLSKKANIMTDLVLNHSSSKGDWYKNFLDDKDPGKNYFYVVDKNYDCSKVVRPRDHDLLTEIELQNKKKFLWCTFSHDQIDLNFKNPDVLLEFIKLILKLSSYGIKIFRLDAVAFIWKQPGTTCLNLSQTHEIIKLLRDIVDQLDKNLIIVTETNLPKQENLSYFGKNDEAHWIYNFSLPPLIVNTFLFEDSVALTKWSMKMPPAQLGNAYLNFIASHDGIGMRPAEGVLSDKEIKKMLQRLKKNGSKFSMRKLSNNEEKVYEANISLFNALQFTDSDLKGKFALKRFIAAHCIILAIEGVPAFYFNSLFATKNDEETFANTGVKRNLNRYKWHYSTLVDLIKTNNTIEKNCYEIFKKLISIRKIQPAFHPNATQFTLNLDKNIFAVWRQSRDRKQSIFALTNVSSKTIKLNTNKINLIDDEKWFDLLSQETKITDDQYVKLMPFQSLWITNLKV
jgi:sucrose phosphorylase